MSDSSYSQRIVCLAAEASEIIDRLGAFERVVGVSGFARELVALIHAQPVQNIIQKTRT